MTRLASTIAALLVTVACAQNQPPTFTSPDDKQPARENVVVQINEGDVMPSVARIKAGGSVTWANLSDMLATVRFPSGIKGKLTCKEPLRPDWNYVADGIESIPMKSDAENVVFPCALVPGTYAYEIWIFGSMMEMDNPQYQLKATLQVE